MKTLYLFRLFTRELKKQKKRVWLTITGIAWGTLSIVLLLSFGEGLKTQLLKADSGLGVNIVMMYGGQTGETYQGLPKGRRIGFTDEDVRLIRQKVTNISLISPEYDLYGATITYKDKTVTDRITGVEPSFEDMRTHYPDTGGRFINQIDVQQRRRVIFLGNNLKDRLMGDEDAIGKTITVNGLPFKVIGVLKEKMQMSMYGGPDADKGTVPASTLKAIQGRTYVDRIVYQVNQTQYSEAVKQQLFEVLGQKYRFAPNDDKALRFWDTIEQREITSNMFIGIQLFLGLIGGLTLLIASVGVANIMYVSVKERTREIGVKRAIGAKRRQIKQQFILEALLIAILGGAIGTGVALVIIQALRSLPLSGDTMELLAQPSFSWPIALSTALILGIVGFAAGYFPSRKAAKVDPIESLRYE